MSGISVSNDVSFVNPIITNGRAYPEFERVNGRITMQTVKNRLYEWDYISYEQKEDHELDYQVVAWALLRAFKAGKLSLNATKQTGIIGNTPIRMSTSLGGKMKGVWAFSTLSLVNPFCLRRMQLTDFVCHHCYVKRSLHIDAVLNYVQNFHVLSSGILPMEWIPIIRGKNSVKHPIVRLESMGDLCSYEQAANYLQIAHSNPAFKFAIWTKNPRVFADAVDIHGKPENLTSVLSMSKVNNLEDISRWRAYFDHCFVVTDDTKLREIWLKNPELFYACKCGPRSCITCQKCYHKDSMMTTAVEMLRK